MGKIHRIPAVRPLAGLLAADPELLQQAHTELAHLWGMPAQISEPIPFGYSDYYTPEMGPGLLRQFLVFPALLSPDGLADWKIAAIALEATLGCSLDSAGRRINIDPGYLAPGKLVLASTKDHQHRIYLRSGIYAEITLRIRNNRFMTWEWTYPDYAEAVPFFNQAYQAYLKDLAERAAE